MIVFNYMKEEYAELAICNKRLKGSEILELNDPFELLPNLRKNTHRDKFSDYKKYVAKNYLLFCFSKTSKSPQMWAHYADKHKGVCLGFEVNNDHIKVKYSKKRIIFDPNIDLKNEEKKLKFLDKLIKTKDINWSYEKEYRFFENRINLIEEGKKYFHKFQSNELELRYVILGMYSAKHLEQKYKALLESCGYSNTVTISRVNKTYGTYSMTTYRHRTS